MNIRKNNTSSVANIFDTWSGKEFFWLHIRGEEGIGKTWFINSLLQRQLKPYFLMFYVDVSVLNIPLNHHLHNIIHHLNRKNKQFFKPIISAMPKFVGDGIIRYLNLKNEIDEHSYPLKFQIELFRILVNHLSQKKRVVIVLENVSQNNQNELQWLSRFFSEKAACSLVLITSGYPENFEYLSVNPSKIIFLKRLTSKEIYRFCSDYLKTSQINSRLISNHLQTKSNGNPRQLSYLLRVYFRKIFLRQNKSELITEKLPKVPSNLLKTEMYEKIVHTLTQKELHFLILISQVEGLIPENLLLKIGIAFNLENHFIKRFSQEGVIEENTYLSKKFYQISDKRLKYYLRTFTDSPEVALKLEIFDEENTTSKVKIPFVVSHFILNFSKKDIALQIAIREARSFSDFGDYKKAYRQYSFFKRNLSSSEKSVYSGTKIFVEIADIQEKLGLYENAFETLRDYRDYLDRTQEDDWFSTTLKMAEILIYMDAFVEARYLLSDLKGKKTATDKIKASTMMLLGDLEKNFSHSEYAQRHYLNSFNMLKSTNLENLKYKVYAKLADLYIRRNQDESTKKLFRESIEYFSDAPVYYCLIKMEHLRICMSLKEFQEALPLALQQLNYSRIKFIPSILIQTTLYLAEIYAYYGKWYLALSRLRNLSNTSCLIYNSYTKVRILLNIAIIEKELSFFGDANATLENALNYCIQEHYLKEYYEIKVHRAHIKLLIHSYLRTKEDLLEVLDWAEAHQGSELIFSAALMISSYELKKQNFSEVKKYLSKAWQQLGMERNQLDKLNYSYYLLQYLLEIGKLDKACRIVKYWKNVKIGGVKFIILALYFEGKIQIKKGNYSEAILPLKRALEIVGKYRIPMQEFFILREIIHISPHLESEIKLEKYVHSLNMVFQELSKRINDSILLRQFQESKVFASIQSVLV
jgi:disulfide oxidoreductase YuzD